MKIAMIGQKGIPATFGGIEKHVEELSVRLVKHGYEVTVFCRPYYTEKGIKCSLVKKGNGKYIYKGVNLSLLPSINTKHLDAMTHTVVSTVAALFTGFDIVHYHALGTGLVSFVPRLFSKAFVSMVHGLDWQRAKWRGMAVWALKLGELSIAYFPKRRIVVSKSLKRYFKQKLDMLFNNSPLLDTLREKVRKYVLTCYNWDTITMDTIEVYEKTLSC